MAAWLVITARGVTTNKGHPLRHNGMARLVSRGQLLVWTVVMVRLAKPVGVAHRGMPMECVEVMLLCSGCPAGDVTRVTGALIAAVIRFVETR